MKLMVLLNDGTVGTLGTTYAEPVVGLTVRVELHDENGNLIEREGILADTLEIVE